VKHLLSIATAQMPLQLHIALSLWLWLIPWMAHAEALKFLVSEVPGLVNSHDNGKVVDGPAIALMHRITQQAGITDKYEVMPLARIVALTEHIAGTCALGLGRIPEIEAKFKWAGPVMRQKMVLLTRPDDLRKFTDLADAKGLIIGVRRKSAVGTKLREAGLQIEETDVNEDNFKKLMAHRIELWGANESDTLAHTELAPDSKPKVVLTVGAIDNYIACNQQVSDDTMTRLNDSIESIIKTGALKKYGL
jgi:polar amino acid transport system substrate-binding protein